METKLTNKILEGNIRAASRLMSGIEDGIPEAIKELENLYPYTGKAYVVGVTGAPGAGKSTLADALISGFRKRNMKVGVIAVDPSSPFTGGALLGDRIRMERHNTDQGVFIRSLATRGWSGGLAKATTGMIHVMDAMSKDVIIVETVGSGQSEIDVVKVADTAILVLAPGMGDEIQMLKAGIMEAADIFAINKADRDGADALKIALETMLEMKNQPNNVWKPNVVLTQAIYNKGVEALMEEIIRHKEFLISSGELEKRRKERAKLELTEAIEHSLKSCIDSVLDKNYLDKLADDLVNRKANPYLVASEVVNQSISKLKKLGSCSMKKEKYSHFVTKPSEKGLVEIFTGDGKGKTSAALGIALRAIGHNLRVHIIYFMKGDYPSGEREVLSHLPNVEISIFGRDCFVDPVDVKAEDKEEAKKGLKKAREVIQSGDYDVVILDEINVATAWKLLDANEVLELIRNKPEKVELILTGRYADPRLVEVADLVTEAVKIKHPYDKGILSRKGVDY